MWRFSEQSFRRCGSYRQKHIGHGYSAPCRWIYVVFCVWDICRSLDQPSKLHHLPLHDLACSTTFSWREIKIKRHWRSLLEQMTTVLSRRLWIIHQGYISQVGVRYLNKRSESFFSLIGKAIIIGPNSGPMRHASTYPSRIWAVHPEIQTTLNREPPGWYRPEAGPPPFPGWRTAAGCSL